MSELDDETRNSPLNKWWLAAGVFMVVVAALLGFVLFGPSQPAAPEGQPSRPSSSPAGTSAPSTGTTSPGGVSTCPPGPSSSDIPSTPPSGVAWELEQGVALPQSKSAGPQRRTGDVRQCFEHSPTGALLSAATYAVSTQLPSLEQLITLRLSPGPEKDAALRGLSPGDTGSDGPKGQIAAFRILSYTDTDAVVSVALKADAGRFAIVTYPMVWTGGDWLVNGAPKGGMPPAQPATDISGYIAWAGV